MYGPKLPKRYYLEFITLVLQQNKNIMDYEPQTMSEREMDVRLELFKKELMNVIESVDNAAMDTKKILEAVDARITKTCLEYGCS